MTWSVGFHEAAVAEANALPDDLQARLERYSEVIREHGLDKLPPKAAKHLRDELWELRLKGKDGIARALYVTRSGKRLIVVRIFIKKTEKTPRREIELALQRAEEVT